MGSRESGIVPTTLQCVVTFKNKILEKYKTNYTSF